MDELRVRGRSRAGCEPVFLPQGGRPGPVQLVCRKGIHAVAERRLALSPIPSLNVDGRVNRRSSSCVPPPAPNFGAPAPPRRTSRSHPRAKLGGAEAGSRAPRARRRALESEKIATAPLFVTRLKPGKDPRLRRVAFMKLRPYPRPGVRAVRAPGRMSRGPSSPARSRFPLRGTSVDPSAAKGRVLPSPKLPRARRIEPAVCDPSFQALGKLPGRKAAIRGVLVLRPPASPARTPLRPFMPGRGKALEKAALRLESCGGAPAVSRDNQTNPKASSRSLVEPSFGSEAR